MHASPILNATHDPGARSWVDSANDPLGDFPVQNLPLAIFRRAGTGEACRGGVAIGDQVLDLAAFGRLSPCSGPAADALAKAGAGTLNGLMAMGSGHWSALRLALWNSLREGAAVTREIRSCLVPLSAAEFSLPATIGDFTDFYTSLHHAANVGALYRPDSPLMPNYKWLPVAYHGRCSSIAASGQTVVRPTGQGTPASGNPPTFGPSVQVDYELELGLFVGPGNDLGRPIPIAAADAHVFGFCILNDWSARDIQRWEYQPLGPFLGKNFATTISPWIVTLEALAPYRTDWSRAASDPQPLPNLSLTGQTGLAALDINVEVNLLSEQMRIAGLAPTRIARSNYRHAYWTYAQMVAHHTANGCNLRPGDLIGTGTLSGPGQDQSGSLLEVTRGGRLPFMLPTGEQRTFVEDGDSIVMRAWCERRGAARIGFGECVGGIARDLVQ